MTNQLKLGAHMSVAGGAHKALERGHALGCASVQIFTKNANQWAAKPIADADAQLFHDSCGTYGYASEHLIAHDSYLINLASPDDALWAKSMDAFGHELDRCATLRIPALVTHCGAHMGTGEEAGLARISEGIARVLEERAGQQVRVLLEITAGQGTSLCYCFEHLGSIFEQLGDAYTERVGVCWDTCHLFAAGIDYTDEVKYERMIESFERIVGLERLRAIHLNDSKKGLGSRVDRHEHIGQGAIGLEPFAFFLNDPRLAALPMVIETPKGAAGEETANDTMNLNALRGLVRTA